MGEMNKKRPHIVILSNVTKIYSKVDWAIKKVSLRIKKGDSIGIIGPNNSGKSVLGKLIANRLSQTSGVIDYFFEEDNIFKAIGYQDKIQQWPNGFRVKDVYKLYLAIHNIKEKEWTDRLINTFGIEEIMNKTLNKLDLISLELFGMFLAMIHKPELLVFDEISSSITYEKKLQIFKLISEYINEGGTFVVIQPDNFVLSNICNRIIYLKNGEIQDDIKIREVIKEYGDTFEYIKYAEKEFKDKKLKTKINPEFQLFINRFNSIHDAFMNRFNENFPSGFVSNDSTVDILVKNTIYYMNSLRDIIIETISSTINVQAVEETNKNIKQVQKEIKKTLKELNYYKKKNDHPVKYLGRLISDFEKYYKFINTKVRPIFKDDHFVANNDVIDIESTTKEKRQLRALKRRYIKEEMNIIKLERKTIARRKKIASMSDVDRSLLKQQLIQEQKELEKEIKTKHINVVNALNENLNSSVKVVSDASDQIEIVKDKKDLPEINEVLENTELKDINAKVEATLVTEVMKNRITDELQDIKEFEKLQKNNKEKISSFFEEAESSTSEDKK